MYFKRIYFYLLFFRIFFLHFLFLLYLFKKNHELKIDTECVISKRYFYIKKIFFVILII